MEHRLDRSLFATVIATPTSSPAISNKYRFSRIRIQIQKLKIDGWIMDLHRSDCGRLANGAVQVKCSASMATCTAINRLCCHGPPDNLDLRFPLGSAHWLATRDCRSKPVANLVQSLALLYCNLCARVRIERQLNLVSPHSIMMFTVHTLRGFKFNTKHAKLRTRIN